MVMTEAVVNPVTGSIFKKAKNLSHKHETLLWMAMTESVPEFVFRKASDLH